MLEAFDNFWTKVRNCWKSSTIWFGAAVAAAGGAPKVLEWTQSSLLPAVTPYISPNFSAILGLVITVGIWYFRFKTYESLADKR